MNRFHLLVRGQTFAAMSFVFLLSSLVANSAFAHAQLIKSNPPDKAELKQPPTRVDLWFNELLDEGFNSIEIIPVAELSAKNHTNYAKGQPKVDTEDRTHLIATVSPLKPGKYILQYRVLSRDGHSAPGRVTFQVLGSKS
jgi:methionine-rich copper-binding protein CopC